jgi:hypothetical protein
MVGTVAFGCIHGTIGSLPIEAGIKISERLFHYRFQAKTRLEWRRIV